MEIEIMVRVNGLYGSWGAGRAIPDLFIKCFEPLKTCDDPMIAFATRETLPNSESAMIVMKTRKDAAKILADEIAKMIVNEMSKNDTHNGYNKS